VTMPSTPTTAYASAVQPWVFANMVTVHCSRLCDEVDHAVRLQDRSSFDS
jgi:hypothetical protein